MIIFSSFSLFGSSIVIPLGRTVLRRVNPPSPDVFRVSRPEDLVVVISDSVWDNFGQCGVTSDSVG